MVVKDTADVYRIVSENHILPGIALVEQSGYSHGDDGSSKRILEQRMHNLDKFVEDAGKKIQQISDRVCVYALLYHRVVY